MKHLLLFLGIILLVAGCSRPSHPVHEPQKRLMLDGASALPPRGGQWEYTTYDVRGIVFLKDNTKEEQIVTCIIGLDKLPVTDFDSEYAFLDSIKKEHLWEEYRSGKKFIINEFKLTREKNTLCVRQHNVYRSKTSGMFSGTQNYLTETFALTCKHPDKNNVFNLGVIAVCTQQSKPKDFIEDFNSEAEYFFENTAFEPLDVEYLKSPD